MRYKLNREEQAIRELERLGIEVMEARPYGSGGALFMMAVGDSDHASYWSSTDFGILGSEELQDVMNAYGMWWEWVDDVYANVHSND